MSDAPKAVLTIDGQEYTLQFNRDAVRMLEATGNAPTTEGKDGSPLVLFTGMFYGALRMHHRNINQSQAEALFDQVLDSGVQFEDLSTLLMELYQAVFSPPAPSTGGGTTIQRIGMKEPEKEPKSK